MLAQVKNVRSLFETQCTFLEAVTQLSPQASNMHPAGDGGGGHWLVRME